LSEALIQGGHEVCGYDNLSAEYSPERKRNNLVAVRKNPRFKWCEGDILNETELRNAFQTFQPEALVHLAAIPGIGRSVSNPAKVQRTNVEGTALVLQISAQTDTRHVVFASSSSVYGGNTPVPFQESAQINQPISPYAASKAAGELLCHSHHHLTKTPVSCLRFFTVYGPRQRPDMAMYTFASQIHRGEAVTLYGSETVSRDFTYVEDIVAGILASLNHPEGFQIFNIGSGKPHTLKELVSALSSRIGQVPKVLVEESPLHDTFITWADTNRAQRTLGFLAKTPFEKGLDHFVHWFLQDRADP
jgi:UDP-glucuronate 4-epimerase